MSVEPKDGRLSVVTRERLAVTLAAPFLLLLASSLASWPWRSLGLPGRRRHDDPARHPPPRTRRRRRHARPEARPASGHDHVAPRGTGRARPPHDRVRRRNPTASAGAAVIVGYVVIYLIALGVALAVAGHGAALGAASISLFLLTQTVRFPVFGVDSSVDVTAAGLLTFTAAIRATVETGLLIVLTAPPRRSAGGPSRRQRRAPRGARGAARGLRLLGGPGAARRVQPARGD